MSTRWALLQQRYLATHPVIRILTKEQRDKHDAKAHVIMEKLLLDFKYVPGLENSHIYMFMNENHAEQFDKLTNNEGRI